MRQLAPIISLWFQNSQPIQMNFKQTPSSFLRGLQLSLAPEKLAIACKNKNSPDSFLLIYSREYSDFREENIWFLKKWISDQKRNQSRWKNSRQLDRGMLRQQIAKVSFTTMKWLISTMFFLTNKLFYLSFTLKTSCRLWKMRRFPPKLGLMGCFWSEWGVWVRMISEQFIMR